MFAFKYWDGEFYHFLDNDTQDETLIPPETLGEARKYIIDDLQLDVLLLYDEPVAVELPESVVMRVNATNPIVGTESHYKHVTLEGPARTDGLVVLAPQFIG